jgi:tRNA threonylcarbamoyladenosine biosynthesis protein TsaB
MLLIALETSAATGSVCLQVPGQAPRLRRLELHGQHGQTLVPAVRALLQEAGQQIDSGALIAVGLGPGSYTGLRVGLVCAKTLAYASGAALVGVDTLLAIACNAPAFARSIQVVADAQRDLLYVGRYERIGGAAWRPTAGIEVLPIQAWAQHLPPSDVATGPGLQKLRHLHPELADQLQPRTLDQQFWQPCAARIAELGLAAYSAGRRDSCWTLEPAYLRRSSAEEKWDQLHPEQRYGGMAH